MRARSSLKLVVCGLIISLCCAGVNRHRSGTILAYFVYIRRSKADGGITGGNLDGAMA